MNQNLVRILLIETKEDDYLRLAGILGEIHDLNSSLAWASSYEQGTREIGRNLYDVVLLAHDLEEYSGQDIVRAATNTCNAPIIYLSEHEDHSVDLAVTGAGVCDYLVKDNITNTLLERSIRYAIERKRVELAWRNALTENNRLASAITNLPTGVLITETRGNDNLVVFNNPAFSEITGYPTAEIVGRDCRFLQGADTDSATVKAVAGAIRSRRPFNGLILNYRKDGQPFWNELRINPIFAGGALINFVGLIQDVTGRIESLQENRKLTDELEERVVLRTLALERRTEEMLQAKSEAEKANAAKSEFLSRMSHELRTPLNSILGFGQLLQGESVDPDQQEKLDLIVTAGRQLLSLINEILDIARVESGRIALSMETVDAGKIISHCVSLIEPLAQQYNVNLENRFEFRNPSDCLVLADTKRLEQVLLNLLSNAVKYNLPDGFVRIEGRCIEGDRLLISISNTGRGILPKDLPSIFIPFERSGDDVGKIEGTGLGLPLSKRLAEAMEGDIEVLSPPGEMTTFGLSLMRSHGSLAKGKAVYTQQKPAVDTALRLLYIEDNPLNLKLIEGLLAEYPDIELVSAMDGLTGIALAQQNPPDLILLDLNLPDLQGDEVLEKLKEFPATRNIPVVILSADATLHRRHHLESLGAREFLTKPLDMNRFWDVIVESASPSDA